MADPRTSPRSAGFSMVEMLVALIFTMLLMAGMATVFKASLSTFYTAGETTSSARRNRMSIDMLGQDLDTADMYLANVTDAPAIDPLHPPFYILPNMVITGDPNKNTADQIFFQVDQPSQFIGTLVAGGGANSAATVIANGGTLSANNADNTFIIDCGSATYANQVVANQTLKNQTLIFKDNFDSGLITSVTTTGTPSQVKVVLGQDTNAAVTGSGSTGLPLKESHVSNSQIQIAQVAQTIRYQIEFLQLDPTTTVGIPCLVRDQGTYAGGVFTPNIPQQIITENVQAFKVYLSVNAGQSWAGWQKVYSDLDAGWTNGIVPELTTQLTTVVKNGFTGITGNPNWFRSIPTIVRVDLTTRSATQRTEYQPDSSQTNTAAYKLFTQSLIFLPRHSGLPLDD